MNLEVEEIYRGSSLGKTEGRGDRKRQGEPSEHDADLTTVKSEGQERGIE